MNVLRNKDYVRQVLWMMALILPWGIGGFAMHTASSLSIGMVLHWGIGLVVPILFFLFQRKGFGAELGAYRAAVHLPLWISMTILEMTSFWNYLPSMDKAFKESPVPISFLVFLIMAFVLFMTLWLDRELVCLYQTLKGKGGLWSTWLGAVFFSGLIPGVTISSFMILYMIGGMRLDPFTAGLFLMEIFTFVFYGKILFSMMTFGFFLFFALRGSKGQRITQVVFSAIFWIILVYIPFVISLHLPGMSSWRAYLDPSYLSVFPLLSDLWMMGISLYAGKAVTGWIFKDND